MTRAEQNAAAADMLREAAAELPPTLGWALYACADHVAANGFDATARALLERVSILYQVEDAQGWMGSKVARCAGLVSGLPKVSP